LLSSSTYAAALRVWDVLLFERTRAVLFQTALAGHAAQCTASRHGITSSTALQTLDS
jgi:hypothetical protein